MFKDKVKVGVYTICRNESKYIRQWVESMWNNGHGANVAYVLDTGSTDGTVDLFHLTVTQLGIPSNWLNIKTQTFEPFRFDTARNENLEMVVNDIWLDALVQVDLDETMIPDFWDDLKAKIKEYPDFERIFYKYAWSHDDDGVPKRVFWYDKVHPATNCKWKYPVHEELEVNTPNRQGIYYLDENKIYLHHWPDKDKSRTNYLPLLETRFLENIGDTRSAYYLIREYMFYDKISTSALLICHTFYDAIMSDPEERNYNCLDVAFMIDAMANNYAARGMSDEAEFYFTKALEYCDNIRQIYIDFAYFAAYSGKHELANKLLDTMELKLSDKDKQSVWYEDDTLWTWKPLHVRAIAACWAGNYDYAIGLFKHIESDYILTPTDKAEAEEAGLYNHVKWAIDKIKEQIMSSTTEE